jgi:nucleotide-binding universal stress UspA family protein
MFRPQVILHPTAYQPDSFAAFQIARDLARLTGGRLVVLHVADSPGPEQISYHEAVSELQPEGYHRRILRHLHELFDREAGDVPLGYVVVEGDLATAIERVARESGAELIVIGTHTAGLLQHFFLGSTAEHIMRQSPCPILIAKPPSDPGPGT